MTRSLRARASGRRLHVKLETRQSGDEQWRSVCRIGDTKRTDCAILPRGFPGAGLPRPPGLPGGVAGRLQRVWGAMTSSHPFWSVDDLGFDRLRATMVEEDLRGGGIRDERVLAAMAAVPRHLFVPQSLRSVAYADRPLPIGQGQTISQPLMVAIMLEAAELRGDERVLDVGTGSGYQAAVLSRLVREVYSVEILPELAEQARGVLKEVGASNVTAVVGDGSVGLAEWAPYDAILVAAAAQEVPEPLVEQLSNGGRLVIPVGPGRTQVLLRVRKRSRGVAIERLDPCAFVPLVSQTR